MRRFLAVALALTIIAAACGGDDDGAAEPGPTVTATAEPTDQATPEPTPDPTGEATTEPTDEPTPTTEPTPEPTAEPTVDEGTVPVDLRFEGGTVAVADDRIDAGVGDTIVITATSDVAEEVHVHGYDLFLDLEPGVSATLEFVADIPGIFEVELEGNHTFAFELEVS